MGLINAPATFQRAMDVLLSGLLWQCCLCYVDDVLIFSETFEQHMEDLANVLERFAKVGIQLRASKCAICKLSFEWLGHIVSAEGVAPTPRLIEAVEKMKKPTNVSELRTFLGLTTYYRKFVPNFSKLPIH